MTRYEQGFMSKCAEYGVPTEVSWRMLKAAQSTPTGTESIAGKVPNDVASAAAKRLRDRYYDGDPVTGVTLATLPKLDHYSYSQTYRPEEYLPSTKTVPTSYGFPASLLKDTSIFNRDKLQFTPEGTNLVENATAYDLKNRGIPVNWKAVDFMTGRSETPHDPTHQVDKTGKLTLAPEQVAAFTNNPVAYRKWLRDSGVHDAIMRRVAAQAK